MSKRINAATSVPHIRVGCSTVAVSWAGIKCNAYLCLYVLPANRGKIGEPTSGLEPLTCSLRVIGHALQGFAGGCKCRIPKPGSFLRLAFYCTVLRSRWYQSGIKPCEKLWSGVEIARPYALGRHSYCKIYLK
jgi:hypothetical protein